MFTMRDVFVEEERCRDEIYKAEYGRFLQQVTPANKFKCLLCIRLGKMLVRFGRLVQTQYANQSSTWVTNSEIWLQSR